MWQLTIDGKTLRLDDMSPATLQRIATKHDLIWLDVFASPLGHLDAFVDLVREAATALGVPAPDLSTVGTVRHAGNTMLTKADEDLPAEYDNGVAVPLAESEPTTAT